MRYTQNSGVGVFFFLVSEAKKGAKAREVLERHLDPLSGVFLGGPVADPELGRDPADPPRHLAPPPHQLVPLLLRQRARGPESARGFLRAPWLAARGLCQGPRVEKLQHLRTRPFKHEVGGHDE